MEKLLADIVKLLVTNGAQAGTTTAESKETPLHLSSANGHLGVVRERHTLTPFKKTNYNLSNFPKFYYMTLPSVSRMSWFMSKMKVSFGGGCGCHRAGPGQVDAVAQCRLPRSPRGDVYRH